MGMNGKRSLSQMEKDTLYNQTRPRKFAEQEQTCRLKEVGPNSFWTFNFFDIQKELNRPNQRPNNRLSLHRAENIVDLNGF